MLLRLFFTFYVDTFKIYAIFININKRTHLVIRSGQAAGNGGDTGKNASGGYPGQAPVSNPDLFSGH